MVRELCCQGEENRELRAFKGSNVGIVLTRQLQISRNGKRCILSFSSKGAALQVILKSGTGQPELGSVLLTTVKSE